MAGWLHGVYLHCPGRVRGGEGVERDARRPALPPLFLLLPSQLNSTAIAAAAAAAAVVVVVVFHQTRN